MELGFPRIRLRRLPSQDINERPEPAKRCPYHPRVNVIALARLLAATPRPRAMAMMRLESMSALLRTMRRCVSTLSSSTRTKTRLEMEIGEARRQSSLELFGSRRFWRPKQAEPNAPVLTRSDISRYALSQGRELRQSRSLFLSHEHRRRRTPGPGHRAVEGTSRSGVKTK